MTSWKRKLQVENIISLHFIGYGIKRPGEISPNTLLVTALKDLEKSLQPIYLTRTYKKTSHTTWTLNIKTSYVYAFITYIISYK